MEVVAAHHEASGTTVPDLDYDFLSRRFLCDWDLCHKRFHRSSDLQRHYRTHTNERPYTCTVCQKAFSQASALRVHNRTHTGERPYDCLFPSCDSRFADASSLARHRRRHKNGKAICGHYRCPTDCCHKRNRRRQETSPHPRDETERTSTEIITSVRPDVEGGSSVEHHHMMSQQISSSSNSTQDITPPGESMAYNKPASFDSGDWIGNTVQDPQRGGGGVVINPALEVETYDCRPPMTTINSNNQPLWIWTWVMATDGRHGMYPGEQFAPSLAQDSRYPVAASLDNERSSVYHPSYSEWSRPPARPAFIDSNLLY